MVYWLSVQYSWIWLLTQQIFLSLGILGVSPLVKKDAVSRKPFADPLFFFWWLTVHRDRKSAHKSREVFSWSAALLAGCGRVWSRGLIVWCTAAKERKMRLKNLLTKSVLHNHVYKSSVTLLHEETYPVKVSSSTAVSTTNWGSRFLCCWTKPVLCAR